MDFGLKGKVIVVTGGCGLLGREFVKAIVKQKSVAVIADCDAEKAKKICSGLNKGKKVKAAFFPTDITSKSSVHTAIIGIKDRYGKIDALVNAAYPRNKNYGRGFEQVSYEDFCENVNLHLGGFFLTCQQFGILFKKQGHGNIVNIASIYGVIPPRFEIYQGTGIVNTVEYAAIKAGIIHMSKYLAKYYKKTGIRVNCISPGGILNGQPKKFVHRYNQMCLGKGMLEPADVVAALLFLLSDASKAVNGQNIIVDDGFVL